jgi:indolepyruvate decarboxylase
MEQHYTVSDYLKERLEQLGMDQMFGVAGNYTAPLLDTILADKQSPIKINGNANEMCAGYAADAYARLNGICGLYVTYSVGAFSLLNTIAGSFVEQVPVVLINGAPTNKEDAIEKNAGLLYSHTTGYQFVDIHMFRPITAAAERITNGAQAKFQIDAALTALLTQQRPVYFEIAEDVFRAQCDRPHGTLKSGVKDTITVSDADAAVAATVQLMKSKPKSIFWAGVEIQRFDLHDQFLTMLETLNRNHMREGEETKFVTSALSKSVVSEDNPLFEGCVTLTNKEVDTLVGEDGVLIGIGAWTTGKDTGSEDIRSANTILAAHGGVFVGVKYFAAVLLDEYIEKLTQAFEKPTQPHDVMDLKTLSVPSALLSVPQCIPELGYDSFFNAMSQWITKDDVMVVDAGFPLIGAQNVHIPARDGFVAQAAWLAIGYSVAAGTGIKCAKPDKRAIVVVGDGAFQETCQAVSDQHAYGQNTVVFVLTNGIYGIEQYLVNPNPFRKPPVDYSDELLDEVYPYNDLPSWDLEHLAKGFGGEGRKVTTVDELLGVMEEIRGDTRNNFLVEVTIPKTNVPLAIAKAADGKVGEDEIENPGWPPAGVY